MSPRTGRPKSDNPKSDRITIRLDKNDAKILNDYCEKEHIDRAEAIRRSIRKLVPETKK